MKKVLLIVGLILVSLVILSNLQKAGILGEKSEPGDSTGLDSTGLNEEPAEIQEPLPKGILLKSIPEEADLIFSSSRFILDDSACLDSNGKRLARPMINQTCNEAILSAKQQIYVMDVDHKDCKKQNCPVWRVTNLDCYITGGSVNKDKNKVLINAACADTTRDGKVSMHDEKDLYVVDLPTGEMMNLSAKVGGILSENNHSFSPVEDTILVSARKQGTAEIRLFTMKPDGTGLTQLTNNSEFSDFDAAWSADGTKIVFVRLPQQELPRTIPTQIWMMNADGSGLKKLTDGGENPGGKPNITEFTIGTDTDPDFSPDGKKVVFDRLVKEGNKDIGIWYMYTLEVENPEKLTQITFEESRDLIPSWGEKGILFTRNTLEVKAIMDMRQELIWWKDRKEKVLEDKYNGLFPIGGNSAGWL